jgi:hypothetical protein
MPPPSRIHQYFTERDGYRICNINAGHKLAKGSSTDSLRKHLRVSHEEQWKELVEAEEKANSTSGNTGAQAAKGGSSPVKKKLKQVTLDNGFRKCMNAEAEAAIVRAFAECSLSLNLLARPAFREMFRLFRASTIELPSRSLLPIWSQREYFKLKESLQWHLYYASDSAR